MENQAKKILIAEDEKSMARALELKLTHEGFLVMSVGDGEACLAAMESETFDLLLLDLIMPKMDGFSVLETLSAKHNPTPVIVLSNLSQQEDEDRARSFGAKGFFIKSNTPIAEVVKLVKENLGA